MGMILPGPVEPGRATARRRPVRSPLRTAVRSGGGVLVALVTLALALLAGAAPALAQTGEGIRGTLNNAGERVPGATITVEQDVELALGVAARGVVLQTGRVVLAGTAEQLRGAEALTAAYLG